MVAIRFYGRYVLFVISAIAAGLAPNVWVLIGARFLMGIGVGIDLPVAMSYLAEFSRFAGKGNKAARLAAWCPMWYAASTVCFLIIFGLYFLLPQGILTGCGAPPAVRRRAGTADYCRPQSIYE